MGLRYAWLLNLDAELELGRRGKSYARTQEMEARIQSLIPRLGALVGDGLVLAPGSRLGPEFEGRAWCPTPSALRAIAEAGAIVPPAPPLDVLITANHRRFSFELGATLEGSAWITAIEGLERHWAEHPGIQRWLLKRPLGFAGRGRRKLRSGQLSSADRDYLVASFAQEEGLLLEPWIERTQDFGLHGLLAEDGALRLGRPTVQRTDHQGAWLESALAEAGALSPEVLSGLFQEAERAAEALHRLGYFGPFNIDGYLGRNDQGAPIFQPRSEINARYSMGFAVGMAGLNP
ncbi:MAG: hypothetical protein U1E65_03985 [Myxococcota bacterium]